jgi:hypothetical protein
MHEEFTHTYKAVLFRKAVYASGAGLYTRRENTSPKYFVTFFSPSGYTPPIVF